MKRFLPCMTLLIALAGCSNSNDLHDSMEEMKEPFKVMRESGDAEQIKTELAAFTKSVSVAKMQKVKPEDQSSFDEGMNKLTDLIAQVEAALTAGNLEEAKNQLNQMADLRKEYHDKFGVGKKN